MAHLWLTAFRHKRFAMFAAEDPGFDGVSYSITPNTTVVNETTNRSLNYTITTTGVDSGTTLYWINSPVESSDAGGSNPADAYPSLTSGSVLITGATRENGWTGTATLSFTIDEDYTTEYAQEEIRILLKTGGTSGPTVATAQQVYIEDTSQSPYIQVSPSLITIQEPGAITFNISSNGIPAGRTISWSNIGTTVAADFIENTTSGTVTMGENGTAQVVLNVKDENVIEIDETIVFNVSVNDIFGTTRNGSTTVTVTNAAPSYSVTPSATQIDEGETVTFTINTTDLPDGSVLYWRNEGTTSAHDFEEGVTQGTVTINNNTASVTMSAKYNSVEANETIVFRLKTISYTAGTVATASTVTVVNRDWAVFRDKSSINEGDTVTFTIEAPSAINGTIYWDFSIDGLNDVAAHDFFEGSSGSIAVVNGVASKSLTAKFNSSGESDEILVFRIYEDSARTSKIGEANQVTVKNSTFNIQPSTNSIDEGDSVTFDITITNVTNGTTLKWFNIGTSVAGDFVENVNSGIVEIQEGMGSITLNAKNDLTTEGSETIKIQLKPNTVEDIVLAESSNVTINDTSVIPPSYDTLEPSLIEVSEGWSAVFTLNTTNVPNGTTLYWTNSGTSSSSDFFPSGNYGSFTVNNNAATISIDVYNDTLTEGSETIVLNVRTGSITGPIVKTSREVLIRDTSLSPVWYAQYDACLGTGEVLTLSHGENAWPDVLEYEGICYSYTQDINYANDGSLSTILFQGSQYITCADCTNEHQLPTYSVASTNTNNIAINNINEGSTVRFNITTENLVDGTVLYWSNNGTTNSADVFGPFNSGSVTINSNQAMVALSLSNDSSTEGSETIQFNLRTGSTAGTIVATKTVTVNDTSQDEPTPGGCYVYTFVNEGGFEGELEYNPCGSLKILTLSLAPGQQGSTVCAEPLGLFVIPPDWSIISQDPC